MVLVPTTKGAHPLLQKVACAGRYAQAITTKLYNAEEAADRLRGSDQGSNLLIGSQPGPGTPQGAERWRVPPSF